MIGAASLLAAPVTAAAQQCVGGRTIAHSYRDASNPCSGTLGAECVYRCRPGYLKLGRHVCQRYEAHGQLFLNDTFFGGRCERLCPSGKQSCASPLAAVRYNSTDAAGQPCIATRCFDSANAALLNLARGNWGVWRQARSNRSGFYRDSANIIDPDDSLQTGGSNDWLPTVESPTATEDLRVAVEAGNNQAATGIIGLGLIMEAVAHAFGWQSTNEMIARVSLTLRSLTGKTPGVRPGRDPRGFFVHFFDLDTGTAPRATTSCLMCTGLMMAGALFCKTYLATVDAHASTEVAALTSELWASIQFPSLLCSNGVISPTGTAIPMTLNLTGNDCGPAKQPDSDGFYQFNEEHYTIWFAFEQACGKQPQGHCSNTAIETMWSKWMGRRLHPDHTYAGIPLLSTWSGYVVHLPYYTSHSFNSDAAFTQLFRNHWLADWTYFNVTQEAGERGRYGLGAGPTPAWCTEGERYIADRLDNGSKSHCRIYSPYITAGYMPAAPAIIKSQLLDVLADGDAVVPVPQTDTFVLWRRSMLDQGWPSHTDGATARFTMVDFSSELFGLSTLFLPSDFYQKNTNYFRPLPTGAPGLRQRSVASGQVPTETSGAPLRTVLLHVGVIMCFAGGVMLGATAVVHRWFVRAQYQKV